MHNPLSHPHHRRHRRSNPFGKAGKVRPYLRIGESGPYATLTITPDRVDDKARYFGYFHDVNAAQQALQTLQQVWNTPSCEKDVLPATSGRACMQYHLGSCLAPCEGKPDQEEYACRVTQVVRFLEGVDTSILHRLETEMNAHAASLRFEKAAACKELLSDLERLGRMCRKRSDYSGTGDSLLFLRVYRDTRFSLFFLRSGQVAARRDFPEGLDEPGLAEFLRGISQPGEDMGQKDWLVPALTGIYADQLFVAVPKCRDSRTDKRWVRTVSQIITSDILLLLSLEWIVILK